MKIRRSVLSYGLLLFLLIGNPVLAADHQELFQTSTIQALMNGVYDGDYSFGELHHHGDFGLGTTDHLDGEMVALDGRFYQVKSDGQVYPVTDAMKTPFGEVVFFKADKTQDLRQPLDLKGLKKYLLNLMSSDNFPYAIKITGAFDYIKTRSVPRQERPYPPLAEVVKHQKVFEFRQVAGDIVGFYHPKYLAGVNVPGFHLHFLTRDRRAGGHLLDCRIKEVRVQLARLHEFELRLPGIAAFSKTDLNGDRKQEIDKVER